MPRYVAPKYELKDRRSVELSFVGRVTLAAPTGPHLTIVSRRIPYPFRVTQVNMVFTDDALNLVRHYWLHSSEPSTSIVAVPSGINLFSREAPLPYFIGRGIIKRLRCSVPVLETDQHIKLHTNNTGTTPYDIDCSCIIEEL